MLRYALIYGPIPGLIAIAAIITGFVLSGGTGAGASQWLGYLIMIVALCIIYAAIRRYRDTERDGTIGFGRALALGLAISVVAGLAYVVVWEIYLAVSGTDFIGQYDDALIAQKQADGVAGTTLEQEIEKLDKIKEQYRHLSFRLPITFLEIFPVGVLVSLISAALLRRRTTT